MNKIFNKQYLICLKKSFVLTLIHLNNKINVIDSNLAKATSSNIITNIRLQKIDISIFKLYNIVIAIFE